MNTLEPANISVTNAEATTRFIICAFPDFRIRGEGLDGHGRPWCHVGDDEFYIAIQTVPDQLERTPYGNTTGLNHLGWVVDDVAALEARMRDGRRGPLYGGFLSNHLPMAALARIGLGDQPGRPQALFLLGLALHIDSTIPNP